MKNKKMTTLLLNTLRESVPLLKQMKPHETHVVTIRANYGNYQIVIGPQSLNKSANGEPMRQIEINGKIHHLFLSEENISANPSDEQVKKHLKDIIIMRDLEIHLVDEHGDGKMIRASDKALNGIEARELINLAGDKGRIMIREAQSSGRLPRETYSIIEEDIMQALEKHPEESIEDVSELTIE